MTSTQAHRFLRFPFIWSRLGHHLQNATFNSITYSGSQRRRVVCTQLPSSTATPLWELVEVLHRNKSRVAFNIRGPGIVQKPNPATDHVGTSAATAKPPQATGHIMLDSIPIWTRLIPRIGTYNTQDSLVVTDPTTSLALTDNACWCRPQEGYQADCRSSTVSFITTSRAMTDSLAFRCLSSRPPSTWPVRFTLREGVC